MHFYFILWVGKMENGKKESKPEKNSQKTLLATCENIMH